ncbi:MAG: hypothetical protein JXQ72_15100 [Anaerolineae bacterium]|nr:hypothetical protein [Anaerolineae bacterium]
MVLISPTAAQDEPIRIIFMHHSTGAGLIWEGGVREAFTAQSYEFWDHGYNEEGLINAAGAYLGTNWDVPGDNTDPNGWYETFNQPVTDPPGNTLSHMLEFDVIIFKSCFPSSHIASDEMFQEYQHYFLSIRDAMGRHPDKLFIPFTTPPLVPNETDADSAARARQWSEYLTSPEYLDGHPNVYVFDFFSQLADEEGFLRAEYRGDEWDSHPNTLANQTVGPVFVDFVSQAIMDFTPGEPLPLNEQQPGQPSDAADMSEPDDQPADQGEPAVAAVPLSPDNNTITDFETSDTQLEWWDHSYGTVNTFTCTSEQGGYNSEQALRITLDMAADSGGGCGFNFAAIQNWSEAEGIRFYWWADQPDLVMRFALAVADPANPDPGQAAPFEIEVTAPVGDWSELFISWDDLAKAAWFDGGPDEFDPAQIAWFVFDLGDWERAQVGSIWIDNIELVFGE